MFGKRSATSKLENTISTLDFTQVSREVVVELSKMPLKHFAEGQVKKLFKDHAASLILTFGTEAAGIVASQIGAEIIKAIWTHNDHISKQLDRIVREPFRTGTRLANKAILLRAEDEDQRQFREKLIDDAILKLEEAESNLVPGGDDSNDRFTIALLQGLCAYHRRGGKQLAQDRFSECIGMLNTVKAQKTAEIRRLKEDRDSSIKYIKSHRYGDDGQSGPASSSARKYQIDKVEVKYYKETHHLKTAIACIDEVLQHLEIIMVTC